MSVAALRTIEREVPRCARCPRLARSFRELRSRYPDYWNRPVPSFGDRRGRLAIVGLAPGLHGANRSGRPFWLDASGEWLYGELERMGRWNGRSLRDTYILNAVKCVPPQNRPNGAEQAACRPWLRAELEALRRARVVLALGSIAHRAVLLSFGARPQTDYPFRHGALYPIAGQPPLLCSYHPSRQNTNTRVLTRRMWRAVLSRAQRLCESE